jgi:hypothetical protein
MLAGQARFSPWCRRFEVRNVIDIKLQANFETETTPGINKLLVSLDPEIRSEPDIKIKRISGSGH